VRFAGAVPGDCAPGSSCLRWCPGDPDPAGRPIPWDSNVCHDFYWDYAGVHDIGTGALLVVVASVQEAASARTGAHPDFLSAAAPAAVLPGSALVSVK
jgi:hypothetical protein